MNVVSFTVNGERRKVEVDGSESLLTVLRDKMALPGSKNACEQGECGSCSVVVDGAVVCSCLIMAVDVEGSEVRTVEGLAHEGSLHRVQRAMLEAGGVQCGFCTPGIAVAAAALFDETPDPSREEIEEALAGNICRCTGYGAIVRALEGLATGAGR